LGKRARSDSASTPNFLAKAEQFLAEGQAALAAQHYDSALLLAVYAAISANDAATTHIGQVRSTDPDHMKAADLLESVTGDAERAKQLRGLINVKNDVEYQSIRTSAKAAADGMVRAERFVGWVGQLLR
jgi:hypothetical protein